MEKETKVRSVRLRSEVINKIQQLADDQNRSFNNMVETILLNFEPGDYPSAV